MGFTGGSCLFSFTKLFFSIIVSFSQPLSKLFLFSTDCFSFVTVFFFFFVSTRFPVPATTSTSRYYVFFYNFSLFYHYFFYLVVRRLVASFPERFPSAGRRRFTRRRYVAGNANARASTTAERSIKFIVRFTRPILGSPPSPPFFLPVSNDLHLVLPGFIRVYPVLSSFT